MAKIFNTNKVTIADLLSAIRDEDNGVTHKVTARDIAKLPEAKATAVFGTEYTAMQMAISQCNMYANLIS